MISSIKKIAFTAFITLTGMFSAHAQTENANVVALLNKADWCSVCKANGPRVEKEVMPMVMQNKEVQLIINDLSNKATKAVAAPVLAKAGLTTFAKKNNGTGMIYFIDAKTKTLISSASLADTNEQIMKAYQSALPKKHGEKGHVCTESCKSAM